jgi:hypothetical protein
MGRTGQPFAKPEAQVAPTPQTAVAAPPTAEQRPPTAPQVTYRDGVLTIVARNSTLGDILSAVRTRTGATIEVPGPAGERVVAMLGPAPAQKVLADLLNGSRFDYVILGSASIPGGVQRVILTQRKSMPAETAVASAPAQPSPGGSPGYQFQMTGRMPGEGGTPEEPVEEEVPEEEPPMMQQQQPLTEPQPIPQQPPAVKTPEQLLQELQQLQRQQQLQQQMQGQPQQQEPRQQDTVPNAQPRE